MRPRFILTYRGPDRPGILARTATCLFEHGANVEEAARYVTPELDEGPIIEQDVRRVTHAHTAAQLVEIGRDVESVVLARAVRWHVEQRVAVDGVKTVVFE